MVSELRAQVGPVAFRLHSVGVLSAPASVGDPFAVYDGAELLRAVEDERAFLVVDHRAAGTADGGAAYAELWLPATPVEGALHALLVLAPPPPNARPLANALSLYGVTQALKRLAPAGYTSR